MSYRAVSYAVSRAVSYAVSSVLESVSYSVIEFVSCSVIELSVIRTSVCHLVSWVCHLVRIVSVSLSLGLSVGLARNYLFNVV